MTKGKEPTAGKKSRGRPRGRLKRAYTVRLDSVLADVLDAYAKIALELVPGAKAADVYEAIFHSFFFVPGGGHGRGVSAKDTRDLLRYLAAYLNERDLVEAERWYLMHTPLSEAEIDVLRESERQRYEERKARVSLRLKLLQEQEAAWTEQDQARLDAQMREIGRRVYDGLGQVEAEQEVEKR